MKMFKLLDSHVTDIATGINGSLTHALIDMSGKPRYIFQPRGLTKEGDPYDGYCLDSKRIEGGEKIEVDVPKELLGKIAKCKISGAKGMIVGFTIHIGNCVHVELKRAGFSPSDKVYPALEMDLRNIEMVDGSEVPVDTDKPSPMKKGNLIR